MPGVLMIETLTQVASVLLVRSMDGNGAGAPATGGRVYLRGVDNAKFRRQVVPGDRLRLEVVMGARRSRLVAGLTPSPTSATTWWLRRNW